MITTLKGRSSTLAHIVLLVAGASMIFPLVWMILLSLSDNPAGNATFRELLHGIFTFSNYSDALQSDQFGIYFINSLIVALIVATGSCIFCTMVAYALARRSFYLKGLLFASVLGVLMVPPHVVMIPLYREVVTFGWINTYFALTLPFIVTPFGIFLMRQYIESLPKELEEAARIDGAKTFAILRGIIFPLATPMLVVLFIYQFLTSWNSFLFPFLFVNKASMRTLPVGLAFYQGKQSIDWGHLMAGAGMSAIPVLILFAVFQRKIIAGFTAGAIKG
ncbi:MAG: carbohydrate ABC transporter permease [Bacteroidota bacterium]|nr:carbohydrate ABC transporter permease [Bacteroidota bacterium]MDP4232649.1 carbohydrate ABC transporter permease [Bacteroidota bacterium]MDP4243901.1 carbohydrate ABC transporter permease [Bacteroidota bacterium]MDP4288430.1 carbohydrate ABC transporter permease [Bacteroidota bacterium]